MRFFLFLALSLLTALGFVMSSSLSYAQGPELLILGLGQSKTISVPAKQKIHVSNGKALSIADEGQHLVLTGKKLGFSRIQAGDQEWSVRIARADTLEALTTLQVALSKMRGLKLELGNDGSAHVRGRLLRKSDWLTLSEIANLDYQLEANFDNTLAPEIRAEIKKALSAAKLPMINLQMMPQAIGFITSEQTALQPAFEKALKPFGFKVEINAALVSLQPLVRVKILVTEINKTMERQIGIKWPTSATAQLLPTFIAPGTTNPLEVEVQAWENSGLAKVLASPNILCRSGKEAEFLAGGEIPIKVSSFASHEVIWKEYGVLLKIQPQADASGRMSIGLETEVSSLDNSNKIDGVPGLHTNRIQTHFDLTHSRTIALSGLIKSDWSKASSGLPELSQIPILGALFSSKSFQNNQTELVVFVTPEVINEDETGAGT